MVSKGTNRAHAYLHASNTRVSIYALVKVYVTWDAGMAQDERVGPEGDRMRIEEGKRNGPKQRLLLGIKVVTAQTFYCTRCNLSTPSRPGLQAVCHVSSAALVLSAFSIGGLQPRGFCVAVPPEHHDIIDSYSEPFLSLCTS